jgi:hypothetical protein
MKRATRLALAFTAVIAGCASPWTVDRFEAPEANFAAKHAYFLKGGEIGTPVSLDPAVTARLNAEVRNSIATELTRKGYVEVADAAAADMIVTYQMAGTSKFVMAKDQRVGAPSPNIVLSPSATQPPPASEFPREQLVRDGSVIVFVDDPATRRLIWRGMITAETRVGSTEAGIRMAADMARRIVQEFPAGASQPAK